MNKFSFFFGFLLILLSSDLYSQSGCVALDLPFFNNFDDGDLECWSMIDNNGDNLMWHIDETQAAIGCSAPGDKVVSINYNFSFAMNDWLFSPSLNLE